MRHSVAALRAALALLTRLPLPPIRDFQPAHARDGAAWYPAVGLIIGGLLGLLVVGLSMAGLSAGVSAVLIVVCGLVLTGALHEDGLADAADGLFGGWTPERRLEIMRDPRLGTYGGAALVCALALRIAALLALPVASWPFVLVTVHSVARWTGLLLLATHGYARTSDDQSLAALVVDGVGWPHLALGSLTLIPLGLLMPGGLLLGLLGALPAVGLWAALCRRRVGGMTGDLVGAGILMAELSALVVLGLAYGAG